MKYFIVRLLPLMLCFHSITPIEEINRPLTENSEERTPITDARAKEFLQPTIYRPESPRSNNSSMSSAESVGYTASTHSEDSLDIKIQPKAKTVPLAFENKIRPIAEAAHANTNFFKDTLTNKYVDRATELSKNVQGLLTDPNLLNLIKKGEPAAINPYIADLDKAIDQQKEHFGLFGIFGKRSNALIKDLQNLRDSLQTAATGTPVFAEDVQEKILKAQQDLQQRLDQAKARQEAAKAKAQADVDNRANNIAQATPASAQDYVNNAGLSIDPDTGKTILDTSKSEMQDDRRTALLDTLKTLQAKPATPEIEAEIQNIQQQLADHHTTLAQATQDLYRQNLAASTNVDKQIKTLESELNSADIQKNHATNIQKAQAILTDLQSVQTKLNNIDARIKKVIETREGTNQNITNRGFHIQQLENQVAALRETSDQAGVAPLLNQIQDHEREIARLKRAQSNAPSEELLEAQRSRVLQQHPNLAKDIDDANKQIATLNKQFDDLQKDFNNQMVDLNNQKNEIDTQGAKMGGLIDYHKAQAQAASNSIAQT